MAGFPRPAPSSVWLNSRNKGENKCRLAEQSLRIHDTGLARALDAAILGIIAE